MLFHYVIVNTIDCLIMPKTEPNEIESVKASRGHGPERFVNDPDQMDILGNVE